MTNEKKAKELLGAPAHWTFNYWLDGFSELAQKELREKRSLLIQMAEWKDNQFKEYLERKKKKLNEGVKNFLEKGKADTALLYQTQIMLLNEIIDELFNEE